MRGFDLGCTAANPKNFPSLVESDFDNPHKIAIINNMSTTYRPPSTASARVRELPTVSATDLKNSTADVIEQVASKRAMAITRHDKPRAVLVSIEEYEALTGQEPEYLAGLMEKYRGMLDRMQEPEQKAAAERLFQATPEELGAAAVWAAQKAKETQP